MNEVNNMGHYGIMQTFTMSEIPNLDTCVLGALELFSTKKVPKIDIKYKRPLVVGSGNAEATGKIIFSDRDAIFASESNFKDKLKNIKSIDGVVIVSASGGKHAPIIAKEAKKQKKHITLITTHQDSEASNFLDMKHKYDEYVFPKQREPYTYNTSTYMGMILGKTGEKPKKILDFIDKKVDRLKLPNFNKYDKFYLIVPPEFSGIIRMLQVKFIELFGREVARDVETSEYVKHATTVVPSNELFISFGVENKVFGKNRLHVPLPKNADYVAMMAISYYIIGKIQKAKEPYFKKNIRRYAKFISEVFKEEITPIVD